MIQTVLFAWVLCIAVGLFTALIAALVLTRFMPLRPSLDNITISTDENGKKIALVHFYDHPPWSHSRFFDVEYDLLRKRIILNEYYMLFHPFSKKINTNNVVAIKTLQGKYDVYLADTQIGSIEYADEGIKWFPRQRE